MRSPLEVHLTKLLARYPLPTQWNGPELFSEEFNLESLSLLSVGLSSTRGDLEVVGSASNFPTQSISSLERAYFELLERISILEFENKTKDTLPLLDMRGNPVEEIPFRDAFKTSETPNLWNFSRSNGVALHSSFQEACERSLLELWERDTFLDYWYLQKQPSSLVALPQESTYGLDKFYNLKVASFEPRFQEPLFVMSVFAFPKQAHPRAPFVFGLAAAREQNNALEKSLNELHQRLSFLWGESIPSEIPALEPNADFHQEYYLHRTGIRKIKNWLTSSTQGKSEQCYETKRLATRFIDITPETLKGKLFVSKAFSEELQPLTFGWHKPIQYPMLSDELVIHPIA